MKIGNLAYWTTTCLVSADFLLGGVANIARPPMVLEGMAHLGYPAYFAALLGFWKVLGAVTLLAPRFPRLKEWAYAGIFFDLTSATVSHGAVGDGAGKILAPLVVLALVVASWALRPASRVVEGFVPRAGDRETRETAHATC